YPTLQMPWPYLAGHLFGESPDPSLGTGQGGPFKNREPPAHLWLAGGSWRPFSSACCPKGGAACPQLQMSKDRSRAIGPNARFQAQKKKTPLRARNSSSL